jgi:hypothetical protein
MFQDAVSDKFNAMRGLTADDILGPLGLQRRRTMSASMVPIVTGFFAGVFAGAAVAFLFAPKPGNEMRRELKGRANDMTRRMSAAADGMIKDVRNALPHGKHETREEQEPLEQPLQPPRPASYLHDNGKGPEHGGPTRMSPFSK